MPPAHAWQLLGRLEQRPLVAEHPREPLRQRHRVFNFGDGYIPRQTYQAEWQLDAEVEYRITPRWSVAIGGQNLTDNYPDRSNNDIYYFGNLPYDVLSPIGSNGAYYYGRVRYTF